MESVNRCTTIIFMDNGHHTRSKCGESSTASAGIFWQMTTLWSESWPRSVLLTLNISSSPENYSDIPEHRFHTIAQVTFERCNAN